MFNNVSEKIKYVARLFCLIGIIISVVCGLIYIISTEFWDFGFIFFFIGVLIAVIGSCLSYVSSLVLYGLGELIEKVNNIDNKN